MSILTHLLLTLTILCFSENVYSTIDIRKFIFCDYQREDCTWASNCATLSIGDDGQIMNQRCSIFLQKYCCPRYLPPPPPTPPQPSPAICNQYETCLSPERCSTLTRDVRGLLIKVCWSRPAMYCCPSDPLSPQPKHIGTVTPKETIPERLQVQPDTSICGKSKITATNYITPGNEGVTTDAKVGDWPWVGALFFQNTTSRTNHFICAGSLISDRWVLTAAHCFGIPDEMQISFVRFGMVNRNHRPTDFIKSTNVYVDNTIIHPRYDSATKKKNDIALLRLEEAVQFSEIIHPICLPPSRATPGTLEYVTGQNMTVIGWGSLMFGSMHTTYLTFEQRNDWKSIDFLSAFIKWIGGSQSPVLKVTSLKVVSIEKCAAKYSEIGVETFGIIGEKTICAGDSSSTTCFGDSGGPLMYINRSTGRYHLGGIVSFGNYCAETVPAVFTRIAYYNEWISKITSTH